MRWLRRGIAVPAVARKNIGAYFLSGHSVGVLIARIAWRSCGVWSGQSKLRVVSADNSKTVVRRGAVVATCNQS